MKHKRVITIGAAFMVAVLCVLLLLNTLGRSKSELTVEKVDLKNDCIYATVKNQLYDTEDNYIIYGASDYLKGNVQLSHIKAGETILVVSNGKVLLSDPYQFDKIYSIQLWQVGAYSRSRFSFNSMDSIGFFMVYIPIFAIATIAVVGIIGIHKRHLSTGMVIAMGISVIVLLAITMLLLFTFPIPA